MIAESNHRNEVHPPALAGKVLTWFCKPEWLEPIYGDLHEQYEEDRKKRGRFVSGIRYWINMLNFLRPFAIKSVLIKSNTTLMFKSHFKLSLRNLRRQKMYTAINLFGLILSVVICLNIALYVADELDYDKFHPDYRNVHRVSLFIKSGDVDYNLAGSQFPMAQALADEYPGIDNTIRLFQPLDDPLLVYENRKYTEEKFFFADQEFFSFFGFELISGSPQEVLSEPNSIVLSVDMAKKYFADEDPIGKFIKYNDRHLLKVTGVAKKGDQNSHINFDFVSPLQFQLNLWKEVFGTKGRENKWYWTGAWTYVKFRDQLEEEKVYADLPQFVLNYFPEKWKNDSALDLQRIDKIHLTSDLLYEIEPNGSLANIKIFLIIGFALLSIAIINFVNLILAQSMDRSKQIGISKNLGATRLSLIGQILTETVLICVFSGLAGLIISHLTIPYVNVITGKTIVLANYLTISNLLIYVLLFIGFGIISGIYPAIYLSRLRISSAGESRMKNRISRALIKEILVGIQFIFSAVLIISVMVINAQREYIQTKNIGFDKENMLVVKARGDINENFEAFKSELVKMSEIINISGITEIPGQGMGSWRFVPEDGNRAEPVLIPHTSVGYDFVKTMDIKVKLGRFFDKAFPSDFNNAFVLNEEAAKTLGWTENPIGRNLELFGPGTEEIMMKGQVIGILNDYHFESLHHPIKPAVFSLSPWFGNYMIKFKTDDYPGLITKIESVWGSFTEKWPLEYQLLDERLEISYSREEKLSQLINLAVGVALVIACIGIFGLSSFLIKGRTKEIGIRRVLGIRTGATVFLLSKNFLVIVLLANAIAWPLAFIAMQKWLENFQYSVDMSWLAFGAATLITLILSFGITSFHAIRVSSVDPVESLRYE